MTLGVDCLRLGIALNQHGRIIEPVNLADAADPVGETTIVQRRPAPMTLRRTGVASWALALTILVATLLASPGGGGTIGNPDLLGTLSAYQLREGSPAVDAGIDLAGELGLAVAPRDFFGGAVPQHGGYDVGASEHQGPESALDLAEPAGMMQAP
jgi:hypothetical protein